MKIDEFRALLENGESQDLDWKKDWPPGILEDKMSEKWNEGRGELLKDLISLANTAGPVSARLVYGVKDLGSERKVFGISKLFDDANFQQWATNTFDPSPKLSYFSIRWNDAINIGVFIIERIPKYPHVVKADLGGVLHRGQVWFRKGTQNRIALHDDLREMFMGEEPIKIAMLGDPMVTEVRDHYRSLGREVPAVALAERDKYLLKGYEIAAYPGTRREIWVGMKAGNQWELILLLKPKS